MYVALTILDGPSPARRMSMFEAGRMQATCIQPDHQTITFVMATTRSRPSSLDEGHVRTTKHAQWPVQPWPPLTGTTIGDVLRSAAARWPHRTALVDGSPSGASRRWSYAELLATSERTARALLSKFQPGEHLAVWSSNSPEWVLLELGAALAGLVLVTVNPAYGAAELEYVLRQARVSGIAVAPDYRGRDLVAMVERVRASLPELRETLRLGQWDEMLAAGGASPVLPEVDPADVAQIQYTSGTTGFPKGAQLTHRGLTGNARCYAETIGANETDVWINPMPLFHTAGCGLATLGALQTGGTHVLPPAFEPQHILRLFEQERGTLILCVPTMLIRLLDSTARQHHDLGTWRLVSIGGAPVPTELVTRARDRLAVQVVIGYGQTETSPYITHTSPDDPHPGWIDTVGKALPHVEIRIVEPRGGGTLPLGTVGEICTRGPFVMAGYFDAPQATAETVDADGWLHTGDLGSMDSHGYLSIRGRLKEMIIRGGENIYPREIEDLLFTHPAVQAAAVLGLPDPEWGEVVAACVQLQPGQVVTAGDLEQFCRAHLASYKVPRTWRLVDQFPQTPSGKVQKFALREQLLAESATASGETTSS
jgi:fatty-acyl-CoA synthase